MNNFEKYKYNKFNILENIAYFLVLLLSELKMISFELTTTLTKEKKNKKHKSNLFQFIFYVPVKTYHKYVQNLCYLQKNQFANFGMMNFKKLNYLETKTTVNFDKFILS